MSIGIGVNGEMVAGVAQAFGTHHRGLNVEEITDLCMRKLLHVADTAPPALREQAYQYQQNMRLVIMRYMHQAIVSDRTTLYNNLKQAGFPDVAEIVLKI